MGDRIEMYKDMNFYCDYCGKCGGTYIYLSNTPLEEGPYGNGWCWHTTITELQKSKKETVHMCPGCWKANWKTYKDLKSCCP